MRGNAILPTRAPASFKRLLGRRPFVFVSLENLAQTVETDPASLLECERVICRLKFDGWPRWVRSQMDMRLKVERVRVSWKLVGEPTEIRRLVHTIGALKELQIASEALRAERDPHAVPKRGITTVNRNLQD